MTTTLDRHVIIAFPHADTLPRIIIFIRGNSERRYRISERRYRRLVALLGQPVECGRGEFSTWYLWQ